MSICIAIDLHTDSWPCKHFHKGLPNIKEKSSSTESHWENIFIGKLCQWFSELPKQSSNEGEENYVSVLDMKMVN